MANGCNILGDADGRTESCCDAHDRAYAKGEFIAKFVADFALLWCLIARGRLNILMRAPIALIMFAAVFTFGWIWWLKYLARRLFGWFPKAD